MRLFLIKQNTKKFIMKQLFFFLFVLTIIACSKDEESSNSSSDLIGTWHLASISCADGKSTTELGGEVFTSTYVTSSKDHDATVVFSENPNSYKSMGSYTAVSTVSSILGAQTQETPFTDFSATGTWRVEGNNFIVSSTGNPDQTAEITKLDAKNFEYKVRVNETTEVDGFKITSTGTYITKLTR